MLILCIIYTPKLTIIPFNAHPTQVDASRQGVDIEEVVDQLGLQVTLDTVGLVALVHVEDLHPTELPRR